MNNIDYLKNFLYHKPRTVIVPSIYVNDYQSKKRSWIERLFTFPWEPLRKYNAVYEPIAYRFEDSWIVSVQTYSILIKEGYIND
jgi:hypothetical protein